MHCDGDDEYVRCIRTERAVRDSNVSSQHGKMGLGDGLLGTGLDCRAEGRGKGCHLCRH